MIIICAYVTLCMCTCVYSANASVRLHGEFVGEVMVCVRAYVYVSICARESVCVCMCVRECVCVSA